jgi:hypothetical protein
MGRGWELTPLCPPPSGQTAKNPGLLADRGFFFLWGFFLFLRFVTAPSACRPNPLPPPA